MVKKWGWSQATTGPYNDPLTVQQDTDMKRLILMMPLIASGCADFSFSSNLDKENFDEYFKPGGVQIYEQGQLADLNYLYLGTVEGESCQSDAKQPIPNAGEARTQARRRVADMGGNAVTFDKCVEFNDTPGCLKQVICYGQALKVAQEK
jgi:RcsF protein